MSDDRAQSGWTRFFRRKDLAGEDLFGKVIGGLARVFDGGDEEETNRQIRAEMKQIFECDDISLFAYDPHDTPAPDEGAWALTVKSGFGEGNRISQRDASALPDLQPGRPVPYAEDLAQQAALKAIALAFEKNAFFGCDIEKRKIVLLENPRPEDDLGSGDLSVLAIPLIYTHRVGRVVEESRVGVLALFKTPTRRELGELERGLRSLLAHAVVAPQVALRDPVTNLYTEPLLREELSRYMNMHHITGGNLHGGFVFGMVDCLKLYQQALETAGKVDPHAVGRTVSETLRGVAECVWRRASRHDLGEGEELRCGVAGRIGHEGFGVLLPLLRPFELGMWAVRASKDVVARRFDAEDLLAAGDVTVTLRVIPFGQKGAQSPAELWKLGRKALEDVELEQQRARRDPKALAEVVRTIRVWSGEAWVTTQDLQKHLR